MVGKYPCTECVRQYNAFPVTDTQFCIHSSDFMAIQLINNIRSLRFARGMTQEELALRTGVSRQTIMSIERGQTNPSVLLAYKIASALDTSIVEVFNMEGKLAPV